MGSRKDLAFLEKLRTATEGELLTLARNLSKKSSPAWKMVALLRALRRCRPS